MSKEKGLEGHPERRKEHKQNPGSEKQQVSLRALVSLEHERRREREE